VYETPGPIGTLVKIASDVAEEQPYFTLEQLPAALDYYACEGYVVLRGLVPRPAVARVRQTFDARVRPFRGHIYRQTTANPERHVFTPEGFMLNPIQNIQDLPSRPFAPYREAVLDLLTGPGPVAFLTALFGEPPRLVQTMHFEGNSATWAHQDGYYLDSEQQGSMAGVWVALEDIAPGAGRFFVCPRSHRLELPKNSAELAISDHHANYKSFIAGVIAERSLACRAPALAAGDVLFWNSWTIHGSLPTTQRGVSRASLTCHAIPRGHRFLQFQSRLRSIRAREVNGIEVHCPKSLDRWRNRAILFAEVRWPRLFRAAKRWAIRRLTR
jgi:phytanoyl-CoA hydroxylase